MIDLFGFILKINVKLRPRTIDLQHFTAIYHNDVISYVYSRGKEVKARSTTEMSRNVMFVFIKVFVNL